MKFNVSDIIEREIAGLEEKFEGVTFSVSEDVRVDVAAAGQATRIEFNPEVDIHWALGIRVGGLKAINLLAGKAELELSGLPDRTVELE